MAAAAAAAGLSVGSVLCWLLVMLNTQEMAGGRKQCLRPDATSKRDDLMFVQSLGPARLPRRARLHAERDVLGDDERQQDACHGAHEPGLH